MTFMPECGLRFENC